MWKNFLDGDEEGSQDNLLDDYEGICSLSPLQVLLLVLSLTHLPISSLKLLSKLSIHSLLYSLY